MECLRCVAVRRVVCTLKSGNIPGRWFSGVWRKVCRVSGVQKTSCEATRFNPGAQGRLVEY